MKSKKKKKKNEKHWVSGDAGNLWLEWGGQGSGAQLWEGELSAGVGALVDSRHCPIASSLEVQLAFSG